MPAPALYVAHAKGLYMLERCTPDRKGLPSRARWRWHSPPRCIDCAACLAGMPAARWWTDSEAKVIELAYQVATTPGEPALEFGEEALAARVRQAVAERVGQGDWLSELEGDG